jgi:hypothetical protein
VKPLIVLLSVLAVVPAIGADPDVDADWRQLENLHKAQKVQVHFWNGKVRLGTIVRVEADALTISEGASATAVKRADIKRITRKSRRKGALLGAAVGAGIGAPLGAAAVNLADRKPTSRDRCRCGISRGIHSRDRRGDRSRDRGGSDHLPGSAAETANPAALIIGPNYR